MNFKSLKYDENIIRNGETIISTYVDDFLIISADDLQLNNIISAPSKLFKLKDLGDLTKFLGMNIERK